MARLLRINILALLIQLIALLWTSEGLDTFRNYHFFFDDKFRGIHLGL